jgi:hypothetical protein
MQFLLYAIRYGERKLYAGFVHDWTDDPSELCVFPTRRAAQEFCDKYCGSPAVVVEIEAQVKESN